MARQPLTYCGQTVRDYDRDRFLLSLTARPALRCALWALFAFNYEISRTREVITETQLGLIRLQWWRDNIDAIYKGGEPFGNPALVDLAAAIRAHDLPQADFEALLYAREFDLEGVIPSGMAGLENYADFTTTPLHRMALKILGQAAAENILRDVSAGYALTGLIRSIPFHEAQGRRYMPEGASVEDVLRRAETLLAAGAGQRGFVGAASCLGRYYAGRIRKCDFELRDRRLQAPPIPFILKAFFCFF